KSRIFGQRPSPSSDLISMMIWRHKAEIQALMCHWLAHSSRVPSRPEGSVMASALSGLHRGICPIPCARARGRKGGENAFDMAQADREQLIMDQMRGAVSIEEFVEGADEVHDVHGRKRSSLL
ncbi:unnamed protein product, partial [Polarella glacialis]